MTLATRTLTRRPLLEVLEDRWVPANLWYDGSNLNVYFTAADVNSGGVVNAVNINSNTAANQVTVMLGALNMGTYVVSGNLHVSIGAATATVTHVFDPDTSIAGNVKFDIAAGIGQTNLSITGTAGAQIGGNLTLRLGNNQNAITTAAAFTVQGNVWIDMGANALDSLNLNATVTTIQGNLWVRNASQMTFGSVVNGHFYYDAVKGGQKSVSFGDAASISGNLRVNTANATGDTLWRMRGTVAGHAFFRLGNAPGGTNNHIDGGGNGVTILGGLYVIGGNGDDRYQFGELGNWTTAGSMYINAGNGSNTVALGTGAGMTANFLGNRIVVVGGNGVDRLWLGRDPVAATNGAVNAGGAFLSAFLGNDADRYLLNGTTVTLARAVVAGGHGADAFTHFNPGPINFPHRLVSF